MDVVEIVRMASVAAIAAATGFLATRWLLDDSSEMHALFDPRLNPKAPSVRTSKLGATRALLEGFVQSLRQTMTETELEAACPLLVTEREGSELVVGDDRVEGTDRPVADPVRRRPGRCRDHPERRTAGAGRRARSTTTQ